MRECLLKNKKLHFAFFYILTLHVICRGGSPLTTFDDFPYWPQTGLASTSSCRCCHSSPTVYCRSSACLVSKSAHISRRWPNALDGVERSAAGKLFLDIQQGVEADSALTDQLIIYSFNLHLQLQHVGWSLLVRLSGEKNPQISEYFFIPSPKRRSAQKS